MMDQCLVSQLLAIIEPRYKSNSKFEQMRNPNKPFCNIFQTFLNQYNNSTEAERKANRNSMSANWALSNKFEIIESRINKAIQHADITGHPISMATLVKTEVFEAA